MGSLKRGLELVAVVLVLGMFAVFAVQNSQNVVLSFWKYKTGELPVFLILLGSLLAGLFVALILCLTDIVRMRAKVFRLERQLRSSEKQVALMKQQPLLEDYRNQSSAEDDEAMDDDDPQAMDSDEDVDEDSGKQSLYPRLR